MRYTFEYYVCCNFPRRVFATYGVFSKSDGQ